MQMTDKEKEQKEKNKQKWWLFKPSGSDPLFFGFLAYFLFFLFILLVGVPKWLNKLPSVIFFFVPLILVGIGLALYWFIFTIINVIRIYKSK